MDLVDICAATSTGDHKPCATKKNRNGHARLQLRKAAVRPPAMQSRDKTGPKQIAEEETPAWLPPKKAPQEVDGTLRFSCPRCEDASAYAPKDLAGHFVEKHGGSPPVYPCPVCTFSTDEFSLLQVHLLSHKDTFSSCCLCNDNVSRTWPEFSSHLSTFHRSGGKYSCETCGSFSTGDFGAFLQHIHRHNLTLEGAGDERDGKTPARQFRGFEESEKPSIAKLARADHVCQSGRQKKRQVHSVAVKPSNAIAGVKTRMTRSSVRETCWLPQDCLSLPGKEFLDKYCYLSDPQATLEETQHFLMETVAAETDNQKWTEALKTVLSSVPPDMSLYQTEDGIDASDLAVLTVKNKITVAQNYAKRSKTSADKKTICPEGAAGDGNESELNWKDQTQRLQSKLSDVSPSEPSPCAGAREDRENRELKTNSEGNADRVHGSGDLKDEGAERTFDVPSRSKTQKRRRRRKSRFKKNQKKTFKIVLKNNPEEKQWVSQTSASPERLSDPRTVPEAVEIRNNAADPQEAPETRTLIHPSEPGAGSSSCCSVEPSGPEDPTRTKPATIEGSSSSPQDDWKQSGLCSQTGVGEHRSADGRVRSNQRAAPDDVQLQNGSVRQTIEKEPSPAAAVGPQGKPHVEDSCFLSEQQVEVPSGSCPDLLSRIQVPSGKPPENQSSPGPKLRWQPAPKQQVRTLKLVAISSSQRVKRPAGDQPVVVLNHPDADIPQVARIMEVVGRHREVQKVVLSRRTLSALSTLSGEAPDPPLGSVQERFTLKLKFRRLSRKKYKIVSSFAPTQDSESKFPCWFCGRIFTGQNAMMVHRRRHLIEWKNPNCEN